MYIIINATVGRKPDDSDESSDEDILVGKLDAPYLEDFGAAIKAVNWVPESLSSDHSRFHIQMYSRGNSYLTKMPRF